MNLRDVLRFSLQALRANLVRTLLTALGLVIGNASVILVVTISLTSRDYILEQIQGIGSNVLRIDGVDDRVDPVHGLVGGLVAPGKAFGVPFAGFPSSSSMSTTPS